MMEEIAIDRARHPEGTVLLLWERYMTSTGSSDGWKGDYEDRIHYFEATVECWANSGLVKLREQLGGGTVFRWVDPEAGKLFVLEVLREAVQPEKERVRG